MSAPENPPAFPMLWNVGYNSDWQTDGGMTLRDWFAGQALAGLAAQEQDGSVTYAYFLADRMLEERAKPLASVDAGRRRRSGSVHEWSGRRSRDAQLPLGPSRRKSMNEQGWIDWNGGECPVDPETRVRVRMRHLHHPTDKRGAEMPSVYVAGAIGGWDHDGTAGDIIAYRIVEPGK